MAPTTDQRPDVRLVAVAALCLLTVAIVSPSNLILGLFCWSMLATTFGSYFADNNPGVLYLLLAVVQTGLFALLWLPIFYLSRRRSMGVRCGFIIALTVVYLGFWLGWTALLYAEMARTGRWL
jgi:hypothetical protein